MRLLAVLSAVLGLAGSASASLLALNFTTSAGAPVANAVVMARWGY